MPDDTDLDHTTDEVVAQPEAAPKLPESRFRRLKGHAGEGLNTDEVMALIRGERDLGRKGDD